MKYLKNIFLTSLVLVLFLAQITSIALAEIDWSKMTDEEIIAELEAGQDELKRREALSVETNDNIEHTSTETIKYWDEYNDGEFKDNSIMVETVIGNVKDINEQDYKFDMWVLGKNGYYYVSQQVLSVWKYQKFPSKPSEGQRIIYEVSKLPYEDGTFYGEDVLSSKVVEENVDFHKIELEYMENNSSTYEEFTKMEWQDVVLLDSVVGSVNGESETDFYFELWVKGESNYSLLNIYSSYSYPFPLKPHYGQRLGLLFRFFSDSTILPSDVISVFELEDNVDIKSIEENYLSSLKKDARSNIVLPFESELFETYSYKKILRNIDDYANKPILLEGTYRDNGLVSDKDGNYYHIYICPFESIKPDIIDFNLLKTDKIMVYGYIDYETYTYNSWTGENTVPHIIARKIILIDD